MSRFHPSVAAGVPVLVLMLAVAACIAPPRDAPDEEKQERPNIVFILADDLGWRDVGFMGGTFYETPNLDRLAGEGVVFTQAYAAAAICSPTRASLLTGKYPARLHMTDWIPGMGDSPDQQLLQVADRDHLPLTETTLAEALQEAGYVTAHIGKWHLGGEGHLPTDQGFLINIAGYHRGQPPSYFYPYRRGDDSLAGLHPGGREGEYLTDRLSEEAARFIETHADRPFFLYLPHYTVHTPLQAPEERVRKYQRKAEGEAVPHDAVFTTEGGNRERRVQNEPVFAAMVESLDRSVGRVLRALEEQGLTDRTIVVFSSDNGGLSVLPAGRMAPPTSNRPLRAGKGWLYEGGIRVPLVIRLPGTPAAGARVDAPVTSPDLYPTLLELAGLQARPEQAADGVSLVPVLTGTDTLPRKALYWHYPHYHGSGAGPAGAVRAGDYKLIEFYDRGDAELYDLSRDAEEKQNLAGAMPDKAETLRAQLAAWRRAVGAQMPEPNPDYAGAPAAGQ